MEGLEPPSRKAPDPKSGVSTNFTTPANFQKLRKYIHFFIADLEFHYFIRTCLKDKNIQCHHLYCKIEEYRLFLNLRIEHNHR